MLTRKFGWSAAATVVLSLIAVPANGADILEVSISPIAWVAEKPAQATSIKDSVRKEAVRLGRSDLQTKEQRPPGAEKPKPWCVRHLVACGALVGYGTGFIVGLAKPHEDFVPEYWAFMFAAPIGAGIGAATGGIIWAYTAPDKP